MRGFACRTHHTPTKKHTEYILGGVRAYTFFFRAGLVSFRVGTSFCFFLWGPFVWGCECFWSGSRFRLGTFLRNHHKDHSVFAERGRPKGLSTTGRSYKIKIPDISRGRALESSWNSRRDLLHGCPDQCLLSSSWPSHLAATVSSRISSEP